MGNNFVVLEGPVWVKDALYLSEFGSTTKPPASRILKVTTDGTVSVAVADSGTNGLAVDKNGVMYGASHKIGGIVKIDPVGGTVTPVIAQYNGARFNSPNDLTVRSDGTIYFTDPSADQTPSPAPQPKSGVYRLSPGASAAVPVDLNLGNPNGITLSVDEKTLYVSSNGSNLWSYPVMADGSTGTGTMLAQITGDGMTVDCANNLYIAKQNTQNIVLLATPNATLASVSGAQAVTNVAFGGTDHKTLYITALGQGPSNPTMGAGLFKIDLTVPGLPF